MIDTLVELLSRAPLWSCWLLFLLGPAVEALYVWASNRFTKHWSVSSLLRLGRTTVHTFALVLIYGVFWQKTLALAIYACLALVGKYLASAEAVRLGHPPSDMSNWEADKLKRWTRMDPSAEGSGKRYQRRVSVGVLAVLFLAAIPLFLLERWEFVTLHLKWKHQAQFAGFYLAQDEGIYERNRLRVRIEAGGPQRDPFEQSRQDTGPTFGVGDPIELIVQNRQANGVFRAVAVIFERSPVVWFSKVPMDSLVGKAVAVSMGTTNVDRELSLWLIENGMGAYRRIPGEEWSRMSDQEKVAFSRGRVVGVQLRGPELDSILNFISGNVDVWSGYESNEFVRAIDILGDSGVVSLRTDDSPFEDHRIYGDTLFVKDPNRTSEDLIKRFVCASIEGWRVALSSENESSALDAVMARVAPAGLGETEEADAREHQTRMLRTLRSHAPTSEQFGHMTDEEWSSLVTRLETHPEVLGLREPIDRVWANYTNEYVASCRD